jgi:hypothetical protein
MNTINPGPQTLIAQVISYYERYLSASPEQLDLLALWTLHTYCVQGASFSPALHITSRHKQSGKTLCLRLLDELCYDPWLHTSPSPALVTRQTQGRDPGNPFVGTLLLDDCRIGTRLLGVLAASFHWEGTQIVLGKDHRGDPDFDRRKTFFPKAIVTRDPLPESLKETSIPLALEPKAPGSPCRRYQYSDEASEVCQTLQQSLKQWGRENFDRVVQMSSSYEASQFPSEFSFRQQDCAEPLLQVAEIIGGQWPARARHALANAFALNAFDDFYSSRQLLCDLRDAFAARSNPEWISTAELLEFLHTMDDRTWDDWNKGKPMSPKDLAALLQPFGIRPHNHRTGPKTVPKGYKLEHLEPNWTRHLPPQTWSTAPRPEVSVDMLAQRFRATVAADSQNNQNPPTSTETWSTTCPEVSAEEPVLSCQPKELALRSPQPKEAAPDYDEASLGGDNPVAANSQNPADIIGQQPFVAANLQKSSTGILELEAGSQQPEAPVAANPQNRLGYIYGEELVAANIRNSKERLKARLK